MADPPLGCSAAHRGCFLQIRPCNGVKANNKHSGSGSGWEASGAVDLHPGVMETEPWTRQESQQQPNSAPISPTSAAQSLHGRSECPSTLGSNSDLRAEIVSNLGMGRVVRGPPPSLRRPPPVRSPRAQPLQTHDRQRQDGDKHGSGVRVLWRQAGRRVGGKCDACWTLPRGWTDSHTTALPDRNVACKREVGAFTCAREGVLLQHVSGEALAAVGARRVDASVVADVALVYQALVHVLHLHRVVPLLAQGEGLFREQAVGH